MLPRARTAAPGSLSGDPVVPLVPRRRIAGLPYGDTRSVRRRGPFDLIGSRPYRPGDDPRWIDRHSSARLSSVSNQDELIVREHHAEERLSVALAVDPSPTMSLHPPELPWLHKPSAVQELDHVVTASAQRNRSPLVRLGGMRVDGAPPSLGTGSIVFFVSDYLSFPPDEAWEGAFARGWDVVPILLQDPTWEQSFPDISGICVPLADVSGNLRPALLTRREAARRRSQNEARYASIVQRLENLGLEPVPLGTSDPDAVLEALLAWAGMRRTALAWSA
jgi:Protein of unknown function DUF58